MFKEKKEEERSSAKRVGAKGAHETEKVVKVKKPRKNADAKPKEAVAKKLKEISPAKVILFGLDLIVRTPQNLVKRITMGDSFLKEITKDGKVLYEVSDR